MTRSRSALLVPLVATAALSWGSAATAAEPLKQGWWSAANPGDLPVAVPAPPDVPPQGLMIQGGPSGPTAFAALEYELGTGESASKLTVEVAPGSVTTPSAVLLLCPLKASFTPAQGGAAAEAPAYDCATPISAKVDADGASFTADVSSLGGGNSLAIALVPGDATSRIVLSKPTDASLTTSAATTPFSPPATADVPETNGVVPSTDSPGLGTSPSAPLQPDPGVAAPTVREPLVEPAPAVAPDRAATLDTRPTAALAGVISPAHEARWLILLLVAAGLAGALWTTAGASAQRPGAPAGT